MREKSFIVDVNVFRDLVLDQAFSPETFPIFSMKCLTSFQILREMIENSWCHVVARAFCATSSLRRGKALWFRGKGCFFYSIPPQFIIHRSTSNICRSSGTEVLWALDRPIRQHFLFFWSFGFDEVFCTGFCFLLLRDWAVADDPIPQSCFSIWKRTAQYDKMGRR